MPGGAVFFHEENGFADAGKYIYEIATEMNKKGVYFPIFGICLGFELILYASAQKELRQDCDSVGNSLALDFQESTFLMLHDPINEWTLIKRTNSRKMGHIERFC